MNLIETQNGKQINILDKMKIGIYPPGVTPGFEVQVLELVRGGDLAEINTKSDSLKDIDAAITSNNEIILGIKTKDCAPVCLSDGFKIGIAHIGWQGFSLGLLEKTLGCFDLKNTTIYVGPFLHSFEIKRDFCYDALIKKGGVERFIKEENGKLIFCFQDAIASVLPDTAIFDTRDTESDFSLPSNRREKNNIKGFLTIVSFV